jgi:tRNA pseudouridine55 synthase
MKTINLYKEKGITSFQALDKLKKIIGIKKCGHTGTLDPMAEGVLPVCVGKATKLVDYLMEGKKTYIAECKFGLVTDTFDTTGKIIRQENNIIPSKDELLMSLEKFKGEIELIIPAFSAVRIKGKRAYELARKGLIQDAGKKISNIYHMELIEYKYPLCLIKVECNRGTYVRSLIHELGLKLECGASMSGLIRTQSGKFKISNSYKLEDIEEKKSKGDESFFKPVWDYLDWPEAVIKDNFEKSVLNGVSPIIDNYNYILGSDNKFYLIKNREDKVLAIAEKTGDYEIPLKILKVFK